MKAFASFWSCCTVDRPKIGWGIGVSAHDIYDMQMPLFRLKIETLHWSNLFVPFCTFSEAQLERHIVKNVQNLNLHTLISHHKHLAHPSDSIWYSFWSGYIAGRVLVSTDIDLPCRNWKLMFHVGVFIAYVRSGVYTVHGCTAYNVYQLP